MGALNIIRRFRDLLDVTFGTPNDGDVVTYDLATDKLILTAGGGGGGGAPVGPAGGALDGTYPNPGLAASVAGAGLSEAADVLAVNVDGSTIEIAADALRVKDGGITVAKLSFDPATQAELDAHLTDAVDAHDASAISNVPAGSIAATDVQAAINELDSEKAAAASAVMDGDAAGGVLSGTYPNPGFAADMATQAELDAHITDAADAHDASAISSVPAGGLAATDVQAALNELDTEKAAVASAVMDGDAAGGALDGTYPNPGLAASVAGAGLTEAADVLSVNVDNSTIEIATDTLQVKDGGITAAKVAADVATQAELDAHVNDTSAAHAASAIANTPAGNIAATDVQAALNELDSEKTTASAALTAAQTEIADQKRTVELLVSDPGGSAITTGDGKAYFRVPTLLNGHNLVSVGASVSTVSSSGIPTVQLRRLRLTNATTQAAADMLTTKLTIDATEFDSKDATTAAVIDTSNDDVQTGDQINVDIDVAGTGAKGLVVTMTFEAP